MQKSNNKSNNASNVFVPPRDHFLDNAGLSESESDCDAIEDGMLIEAPVTPEMSLAAPSPEGKDEPTERQKAASQDNGEGSSGRADGMIEGDDEEAVQAGVQADASIPNAVKDKATDAFVMPNTPQVGGFTCKLAAVLSGDAGTFCYRSASAIVSVDQLLHL